MQKLANFAGPRPLGPASPVLPRPLPFRLALQFSKGKDADSMTAKEVVDNFARMHERRMAAKVC